MPERAVRRAGNSSGRKLTAMLLSGVAAGALAMPAAFAQQQAADNGIEAITVSATRRNENLQDVPISIQAFSGDTLQKLNIENFDDIAKQLPNVTLGGFGPGQANIYMRGLSVGGDLGGQGGGSVGSFPNVAVYLDDQSAQVPGKNLDLYSVDLQRVEVLEGPQGVTFGSGAQAGVVRYITNKPDLDKFAAYVDAGVAGTAHGDPSGNGDVTVNVPIIEGQLAARLVLYDDHRGGYINNVPGTFARQGSDKGIHYAGYTNGPGPATPTNSINNNGLTGNAINPVDYAGGRLEVLYKFNDDWNVLVSQSYQQMDAQGVFYEMEQTSGSQPVNLPPLSVQNFEPSYDRDTFENTALTINGRLYDLNLVYTGAYLERDVIQAQDYTNYARGLYADYYQCLPPAPAAGRPTGQCYSPGATWRDKEHDTHLSQEFRVSTPDDWRFRALGGLFWEDFKIQDTTDFDYLTAPGFTQIGPGPGVTSVDPSVRGTSTGFFNDITRGYSQYAIYGSADFDIIPKVLTLTFGSRWYDFHNYEVGSSGGSFGCAPGDTTAPPPCIGNYHNLNAANLKSAAYGFSDRANLTYHITPDIMTYFTWSEGYRPGGFNRSPPETHTFIGPSGYTSDNLTNYELGYKTQWFDHHLLIDGAFYQEDWSNVQDRLFDPGAFGNLSFTVNGPDYRVRGTEMQVTGRVTQDLTLSANASVNETKQLTSPAIEGTSRVTGAAGALPGSVGVFGDVGDSLALSPWFKGNMRARYEFDWNDYLPFAQIELEHSARTHSAVATFNNFEQKGITTVDASMGVSKDAWSARIYVDNLFDERGQEFISAAQFVKSVIVTRPLTAGLKFSYAFD